MDHVVIPKLNKNKVKNSQFGKKNIKLDKVLLYIFFMEKLEIKDYHYRKNHDIIVIIVGDYQWE